MSKPKPWDDRGMPPGYPPAHRTADRERAEGLAGLEKFASAHRPTVIDAKWDQGKWDAMKAREAEQIVPVLVPVYSRLYRVALITLGFIAGAFAASAVFALVR